MIDTKPGPIQGASGVTFRLLAWNLCIWLLRPSYEWFDPRTRPS